MWIPNPRESCAGCPKVILEEKNYSAWVCLFFFNKGQTRRKKGDGFQSVQKKQLFSELFKGLNLGHIDSEWVPVFML